MHNVGAVVLSTLAILLFWAVLGFGLFALLARRRAALRASNYANQETNAAPAIASEPAERVAQPEPADLRPADVLAAVLERDNDASHRRAAAVTLGTRGGDAAVEALIAAVKRDASESVRLAAVDALMPLKENAPRAATFLVSALNSRHEDVRHHVARSLGPAALPEVMRLFRNPDPVIRVRTLETLGHIDHPATTDAFLGALDDGDSRVRRVAVKKLEMVPSPDMVEPFVKLLGDSARDIRLDAIELLVRLKDPRGVEPLMRVLGEDDVPEVRVAAATALGTLGDERARGALTAALDDTGEIFDWKEVHNYAIEGDPVEQVPVVVDTVRGSARRALARLDRPAKA